MKYVRAQLKTGLLRARLLFCLTALIGCVEIMVPHYLFAAPANIPGFSGAIIKAPVVQVPVLKPAAAPLNIPGYYGSNVTPPPAATVPQLKGTPQGATVENPAPNQLIIQQDQQNAVIDWQSFHLSADASVTFNQKGTDAQGNPWVGTALNRIWDKNPSLIFGKLTADGRVYLINQNGIFFAKGSQVNVNSLTASALNIADDDFIKNVLQFRLEDYQGNGLDPLSTVSNLGEINAADGGYLFLMAPRAENIGSMNAPSGQIGLVAGTDIRLVSPGVDDNTRAGFYVLLNDVFNKAAADPSFGNAVNQEGGNLNADGGIVGMYGNRVDQNGAIRSMTAFKNRQGQVELRAANKVTTGVNSSISLPVNPSTTEKVNDTFNIQPVVNIGGLQQLDQSGSPELGVGTTPSGSIELRGSIAAPTGSVSLYAADRIYLETGSLIDVSGVVAELPTPVIEDFKLNSVELRDYYGQKGGILQGGKITTPVMAGSTIGDLSQVILTRDRTALERSIGGARTKNADGSYITQSGDVNITAANGDIIIKQGAAVDFSGGEAHYSGGLTNSTKVLSGNKVYDISNAPALLHYDKIIGLFEKTYDGFGVKESYSGIYYGGANPLKTYAGSYTQGGDAGRLTLAASNIVLAGQLSGGVTRGVYQNTWTAGSANSEAMALSVARGLEAPRAGTLVIGNSNILVDPTSHTKEIAVLPDALSQLPQLAPDAPLQTGPTLLSSKILNDAHLSTLNLYADLTISTDKEAGIQLQPGGSFSASARRIEHRGSVKATAGTIDLSIGQNLTSQKDMDNVDQAGYVPLQERIVLAPESRLDVSGERLDYTLAANTGDTLSGSGQTGGGTINLKDKTDQGQGVFMQAGASVDVSGGYIINQKGTVAGGNAGSLSIQGSNIMLEGDLRGYALADSAGKIRGGSLTLTSTAISVGPAAQVWPEDFRMDDEVPAGLKGKFVLAGDRFDETGFTRIALVSINDIVIAPETTITPSLVRLNNPLPSLDTGAGAQAQVQQAFGSTLPGHPELVRLYDDMAYLSGATSFSATAGSYFEGNNARLTGNLKATPESPNLKANITISAGAQVLTAPATSSATGISLRAPSVDVAGKLGSPGGNITVNATVGNLWVKGGAEISAPGYTLPDQASTPKGADVNRLPVSGGNVTLSAPAQDSTVKLDKGSLIDVSGSEVVENRALSGDKPVTYSDAGNPGSLSLTSFSALVWSGTVNASANMDGVQGGSLIISRTDSDNGLEVRAADITRYIGSGFDDLTLKSQNSLIFSEAAEKALGRKLTLDAPVIRGAGKNVTLSAPWILLSNRSSSLLSPPALPTTAGALTLSGQWIDVIGSTQFGGFQNVTLKAARDIRLSQALYAGNVQGGKLTVTGNLVLDADRIYPGNYYSYKDGGNIVYPDIYSDFVVHADKTVTIRHTDKDGKPLALQTGAVIYSAGGSLTVEGLGGIDVEKGATLAAPLGTLALSAPGKRIYLADGSALTTAGNTAVNYGLIDSSNLWVFEDKANPQGADYNSAYFSKDDLVQKSVSLDAGETVVMKGALIDVSGGGSVFAYKFLPGVEGSSDPLTKTGRYIVFTDNAFQMPGPAVHLSGGGGLAEGVYALLPLDANNPQNARYAFMPGAYILELQTGASLPVQGSRSKDGYPLTVGYASIADTSILGTRPKIYSVRPAAEVLTTEGSYIKPDPLTSGDAGDIAIKGSTTIIDGLLDAAALPGYRGGKIALAGTNVIVQSAATAQLSKFAFGTSFDSTAELKKLKGQLTVSVDSLSDKGFREVSLGDKDSTQTITIGTTDKPVELSAAIISLAASQKITLVGNATLLALTGKDEGSGEGVISLTTPGSLLVSSGSTLHATHNISLDVNDVAGLQGALMVDNSSIILKSRNIFFGAGVKGKNDVGLYLTADIWKKFTGYEDLTLVSGSEIQFREDFTGASQLSAGSSLTLDAQRIVGLKAGGTTVTLAAPTVNIKNSGASSAAQATANAGTFTVEADSINIGYGDVLLGGFATVQLNSKNDLTFLGKGSLTTGNAELAIRAARVTAASTGGRVMNPDGTTSSTPLHAANFTVYTGANYFSDQQINLNPAGAITLVSSGGTPGQTVMSGGMLEFQGTSIDLAGIIQIDGGSLRLNAAGRGDADGIFLRSSGQLIARGTEYASGGSVLVRADRSVVIDQGAVIDVSAGAQGDAGFVKLQSLTGGVLLAGAPRGTAKGGVGGSLALDTDQLSEADMAGLIDILTSGGFNGSLDIRSRVGNIDIASGQTLKARHIRLTADDPSGGQINVYGAVESLAGGKGGVVELYAMNDLNIQSGGNLRAVSLTSGPGGPNVILSSAQGVINIDGTVDVSDSTGANAGGVIYLRALRKDSEVNINIKGTLTGAAAVYAEAVRVYDNVSNILATPADPKLRDASAGYLSDWQVDTAAYMAAAGAITQRLSVNAPNVHLLPGIEVRNAGDITLATEWDLSSHVDPADPSSPYIWRYGSGNDVPGVLTLRAGGDLYLSSNLVDHPTAMDAFAASGPAARGSWAFNLAAGADTSGADYMSVHRNAQGDLVMADQTLVYTESAPVSFASGGDTSIGMTPNAPGYMINSMMSYNLASHSGHIRGRVGRDLIISGGAIQSATGDIDIKIERDLQLNFSGSILGAIRTTGRPPVDIPQGQPTTDNAMTDYWRYAGGGDITLSVGRQAGSLSGPGNWVTAKSSDAWDSFIPLKVPGVSDDRITGDRLFQFAANYTAGTSGVATMGGGDVTICTGGDFLAQAGTFGAGDLKIYSGGDIRGRFLNAKGNGELKVMGNFGSDGERQQIELSDSRMTVTALGDIQIGAVLNPSLASNKVDASRVSFFVNCTYTQETSLSLKAGGDVTIAGRSPFYSNSTNFSALSNETVLPASVSVDAGGNIFLLNNLTMASSPTGNLRLVAGGDISGAYPDDARVVHPAALLMSDITPDYWYGLFRIYGTDETQGRWITNRTYNYHGFFKPEDAVAHAGDKPLHLGDTQAVVIEAGQDIRDLKLLLPKMAAVTAGRDIIDIKYEGQNIGTGDVSKIRAGGNISMKYSKASDISTTIDLQPHEGLIQGGPGVLFVQAGESIDLGSLKDGIQTIGSGANGALGMEKSGLIVLSGYKEDMTPEEVRTFFNGLRDSGDLYSMLMAGGTREDAEKLVKRITTKDAKALLDELRQLAGIRSAGDGKSAEDILYDTLTSGGNQQYAEELLQNTRANTINVLAGTPNAGDINMTSSQIATSMGQSDIFVMANGSLNLGKTALTTSSTANNRTGITTGGGGAINVFSGRDVNVNESRVMTFYGGDVTVWSDQGSINAGRGSRTAISASPPRKQTINGVTTTVFTPPAIGSGIRAVTYGDNAPAPGNIHLFAPSGIIDAGEAGISGGQIILAALHVVNAVNISFSSGSVGVPKSSEGTAGIGTMAGAGTVTQGVTQLAQETAGIGAARAVKSTQIIEDIMAKWLDVKVIDFVQDENEEEQGKP